MMDSIQIFGTDPAQSFGAVPIPEDPHFKKSIEKFTKSQGKYSQMVTTVLSVPLCPTASWKSPEDYWLKFQDISSFCNKAMSLALSLTQQLYKVRVLDWHICDFIGQLLLVRKQLPRF